MNKKTIKYAILIITIISLNFITINSSNANEPEISAIKIHNKTNQICLLLEKLNLCTEDVEKNTLNGTGYIELTISNADFLINNKINIINYNLKINGVILEKNKDMNLVEISLINQNKTYLLKYELINGDNTKILWSNIYGQAGLQKNTVLQPSLQYVDNSKITITATTTAKIKVTTALKTYIALTLILLSLISVFILARNTDVLRDEALPTWWEEAKKLRKQTIKKRELNKDEQDLIKKALDGEISIKDNIIISILAESNQNWKSPRASYSLTKVQLASWFIFTLVTGVYFWVIFDNLPDIESGILISLLGINGGLSVINNLSDQKNQKLYIISNGFWTDITTGFDDEAKIYRYQSVLINITLLTIGFYDFFSNLTYPTFPPSWLAFLAGSAAYYAFGRELNKNISIKN